MRIGLIADLAVGMHPSGSHGWSRQGDILGGLAIGAPPDLFNPRGQNWGLTGFSPRALINGGFTPFLATVRAALRNAGGLRIDHAMGLARLWLIPDGAEPSEGAYLSYPLVDLLRLLALELQRHRAVVVGEDLGTVPEGFRETLETAGLHGMRVLWFERSDRGFAPPNAWDHAAVGMTSTHDLPTVAGWWRGSDITTRGACDRLGIGVKEADVIEERAADRRALWRAFVDSGTAQGAEPQPENTPPVVDAALVFTASTGSPLICHHSKMFLALRNSRTCQVPSTNIRIGAAAWRRRHVSCWTNHSRLPASPRSHINARANERAARNHAVAVAS